jgi:hypothetical protein
MNDAMLSMKNTVPITPSGLAQFFLFVISSSSALVSAFLSAGKEERCLILNSANIARSFN